MAGVSVVLLDPRLAPKDQTVWAFTDEADAQAVAAFLNAQLGGGNEVAWVESVPLARKLNDNVLHCLDLWEEVAEEIALDDG